MNGALKDLVHHHNWATRTLIDFCRTLPEEHLKWTAAGAYGNIHQTLAHLVEADAGYFSLITGRQVIDPSVSEFSMTMADVSELAANMIPHWEAFLEEETDIEGTFPATGGAGERYEVAIGVAIAQVFNHANIHREQVCSILTANGIEPPVIDGWQYGLEAGRGRLVSKGDS